NFKDGSKTITFAEIEAADKGSDFTDFGAPNKKVDYDTINLLIFLYCPLKILVFSGQCVLQFRQ
ncbi:MAG: hypothetical protein MJ125_07085, partial [Clostridia bacterium]|nr:hypothetical protein [Clostridia bacterium]